MDEQKHFLCLHGHFYQPPRENPWTETIDRQDSAAPFHDWNARISAECYRANGRSRMQDEDGWIIRLTNNYSRISFNFGPTVLSWMEEHDPRAYAAILDGDRQSLAHFGGHGSAIAQVYNHMIMPLASRRDKITQVKWGLYDFEKRFGREAEAMWLPETAVDLETLEILADHGMKYVILAPRQAKAVRGPDEEAWHSVKGEQVNPRRPYRINLPDGGEIAAFFYDGMISRSVAFEGLLDNGGYFAERLVSGFDLQSNDPQLLHIATDGESYGHHHRHGDMALAYALEVVEQNDMARLTNYGEFLEHHPPEYEAEIFEDSSWSCIHGVERWRRDCGCNSGMHDGWQQQWRGGIRQAMDDLTTALTPVFEKVLAGDTDSPWQMRDDYIKVIQDRSPENIDQFLNAWCDIPEDGLSAESRIRILKALEMQRHLMLMYTSCAWFFDEISGVETVQVLQYAAKAMELAKDLDGNDYQEPFLKTLESAPSNMPQFGNGRTVFEKLVKPARMDIPKIAVHLVAMALFENRIEDESFACFEYHWQKLHRVFSGKAQLIIAKLEITSRITGETRMIESVAVHFGDYNLNIGAVPFRGDEHFDVLAEELTTAFERGDMVQPIRLLNQNFAANLSSLNDLFHEQQQVIIKKVYAQTLQVVEEQFNNLYRQHYSVMSYLSDIHVKLPAVLSDIAHFVENNTIQTLLAEDLPDPLQIERALARADHWEVNLDVTVLHEKYIKSLLRVFKNCKQDVENREQFERFYNLLELKNSFPFDIDLGDVQNRYAVWAHKKADPKDPLVRRCADFLKIRMDHLEESDEAA